MLHFIETILQISLSTAAVIGILLLLVPLWQKRYSARWRKVIWLILAVRLLVPFSLDLPQTAVQLEMDLQAAPAWQGGQVIADSNPIEPAIIPVADVEVIPTVDNKVAEPQAAVSPVAAITPMQRPVSRGVLFFAIWLAGAVGFLLWHGVQYGFFRRRALAAAQPLEDSEVLLQQAAADLQLKAVPHVAVSAAVQGPMLLGFVKPVMLLPQRFYGKQELTLILRHELTHYKFHDLWYKLLLLMANGVHWFNPLVWLMVRQANRDVEQVCDEFVVRNQNLDYRKAYSMTILNAMANQKGIALSTYLSKQAQNSKSRFSDILYPKQVKKGIVALLAVVLLAVTASGCLQVGPEEPVDAGLALYEKIAPWLPEGAIEQPENYTVGEITESYGMTFEVGEKIYAYDWLEGQSETAAGYFWDENGQKLEEYIPPKRCLNVYTTGDDKIYGIYYSCDETELVLPEPEVSLYGKDDECMDYVKQIAKALIPDAAKLQLREISLDPSGLTKHYRSEITADNYRYDIVINTQYRYLSSVQKSYDNPEQLSQAQNWLSEQFYQQMDDTFYLENGGFSGATWTQSKQDDTYILKLNNYLISWRPQITKQQWAKLDTLMETDPEGHQFVWENLKQERNGLYQFTIEAPILEDGTLDLEQAVAYPVYSVNNRSYRGETPLDWQQEAERWQMLWAAAHFAQGYTEKQPAMMDFFGQAAHPQFADYDYNTTIAYLLSECDKKSIAFTGESGYTLQIELPNDTQANDYLTMTMEQIDGQWQVTDAQLEK